MAKFYATFDGSSGSFNGVNFHDKLNVASNTRASLISARDALSDEFYATIDAANRNGNAGIVIPRNGFIGSAGGYGGPTLYTYDITKWNVDPTVRPIAEPTTTGYLGSTPGTITDAWSIGTTNYNSATSLVSSTITGISGTSVGGISISNGPFGRLGPDPYRTLASLHYDSNFTYFAWNDFLPGQLKTVTMSVQGLTGGEVAIGDPTPTLDTLIYMQFSNADYEFLNDDAGNIRFLYDLGLPSGGGTITLNPAAFSIGSDTSGTGPANPRSGGGSSTWTWTASTKLLTWTLKLNVGAHALSGNARLFDDIVTTNVGTSRQATGTTAFTAVIGAGS